MPTTPAPGPLRVQIIGFGVVGRGVAKALSRKVPRGAAPAGMFRVVAVTDTSGTAFDDDGLDLPALVRAKEKHGALAPGAGAKLRRWDGEAAIRNARADVVVEVTPTDIRDGGVGLTHIAEALRAGKAVVTANKGPLALRFGELTRLAERAGVPLKYGGSVCGAVPIIELARDALVGNVVSSIRGVINGSTNFILSRMEATGQDFADVLEEARAQGITETDPSQDVDGWDAAVKLVILANAVMGRAITLRDVSVTGIRGVTAVQVKSARAHGRVVRLIAEVSREVARVAPTEIDAASPLAVQGTLNVAVIETDLARDITIVGRGAGQMETASAILADLHAVRRERERAAGHPQGAAHPHHGGGIGAVAVESLLLPRRKVVTVGPDHTLGDAVALMRSKGISQVPVMRDGVCVGSLHERVVTDLVLAPRPRRHLAEIRVTEVMAPALPEIGGQTPVVAVARILERHPAVLVTRGLTLLGIVTKADLLRLVGA